MSLTSHNLGILGEELACIFLKHRGYKVLIRNFRCVLGEIDVVARHKKALVFIEVKSRTSQRTGLPLESIHFHKREKIIKCSQFFLKRYGVQDVPCRFDVVSVFFDSSKPKIEILKDAFQIGD